MPDRVQKYGPARSLSLRIGLLLVIFLLVPLFLYMRFQAADRERNMLLEEVVERQGQLITAALTPAIHSRGVAEILEVASILKGLGQSAEANVRLLLRPATGASKSFFYVAAWPVVDPRILDREREALVGTGVLERVRTDCNGHDAESLRYINARGEQELISSVDTIESADGCWVVVTSYNQGGVFNSGLARTFVTAPEIQVAAAVYLLLAAVAIWLSVDIWVNLKNFERLAAGHSTARRAGVTFRDTNRFRELDGIAGAFDRMVRALEKSADDIRRSAEDNAHAFKAPIAVMRQAVDPVRRVVADASAKERRSVEIIEASLDKLEALIGAARALDHATADNLAKRARPIDVLPLLRGLVEDYADAAAVKSVGVEITDAADVHIFGDEEMLEIALENLIGNAVSFAPPDTSVRIQVERAGLRCRIVVSDDGPGIAEDQLENVFNRYVSMRPVTDETAAEAHFGIGLFVVRRNLELMGGTVSLHNRPDGGLDAVVDLPAMRKPRK